MKTTVRNKDGGFVQFLRSHKAMALIIFTVFCIALYLVKNSLVPLWRLSPPPQGGVTLASERLLEYFNTGGDAAKVTWAHAVNNAKYLDETLKGDVMMLEADVLLDANGVAIMAHPPDVTSDLTLETFLDKTKTTPKGIKLDFKSIKAAETCLKMVGKMKHEMNGRIWLNADIIPGTKATTPAVDADKFLQLCVTHCPDCMLSLGWTLAKPDDDYKGGYDWTMVKNMQKVLAKHDLQQPVTFAVEATYMILSTKELEWLLSNTPRSSLTLWFHQMSQANAQDLMCLRDKFGKSVLYMDMPDAVRKEYSTLTKCNAK